MNHQYLFALNSIQPKVGSSHSISNVENSISLNHPLGHVSTFHFEITQNDLIFHAQIAEPKEVILQPKQSHPEWYFHDHFVLMLDPKHDHMTQYLIGINKNGTQISSIQSNLPGEEPTDILSTNIKSDHLLFQKDIQINANGWVSKLVIPLKSLGLDHWPAVMGVKVKFGFPALIMHEASAWPTSKYELGDLPFDYGNLLIHTNMVVSKIDFGTPFWQTGEISSSFELEGKCDAANSNLLMDVTTTNVLGKSETVQYPIQWLSKGSFVAKGKVNCHFANKWAPDFTKSARVAIEIKDKEKVIWNSSYPFGFDAGMIVREPFGKFKRNSLSRPNKNDPNFVDNFRCWLFSKLPNWVYQTTKDKAPSDFYLKDLNGKFSLNLMDDNSLEQIADYIKSEFEDWQDGLCATSLLLQHHFLTRHSGSWAKIAGKSTVTTVLRYGGCFCGDTARISANVADLLGQRYQVKLKGFALGLRGHLTGLVETPIGEVLIDPMLGIYYHALDNSRLATLDEMREDKRIQERMWLLAYSNGHEFFIHTYNQIKRHYDMGKFVYPG